MTSINLISCTPQNNIDCYYNLLWKNENMNKLNKKIKY